MKVTYVSHVYFIRVLSFSKVQLIWETLMSKGSYGWGDHDNISKSSVGVVVTTYRKTLMVVCSHPFLFNFPRMFNVLFVFDFFSKVQLIWETLMPKWSYGWGDHDNISKSSIGVVVRTCRNTLKVLRSHSFLSNIPRMFYYFLSKSSTNLGKIGANRKLRIRRSR